MWYPHVHHHYLDTHTPILTTGRHLTASGYGTNQQDPTKKAMFLHPTIKTSLEFYLCKQHKLPSEPYCQVAQEERQSNTLFGCSVGTSCLESTVIVPGACKFERVLARMKSTLQNSTPKPQAIILFVMERSKKD